MQYTDTIGRIATDAWIVFAIVWAVSAIFAKRTAKRNRKRLSMFVMWLIFMTVVVILAHVTENKGAILLLYIQNPAVRLIGAVLVILGIALAFWARYHLGRNWGQPMSEKVDAELVTTGPYAHIRHPIYAGIFLSIIGSALVFGVFWALILTVYSGYFLYSIGREDEIMARLFPQTYSMYRSRTKRLIPGIW
ncbi:MAG: isoprenylcysteine carboxylmethyltransferase family protein [Patescibacteria group bacterium]|nr:isoprenylcysteine carboxylmethyltransferase family protein [Patescibacteria group bacterium]MDE2172719.1 isoprenylcysteine carboxylmethyltransferase family protein [Patescibacteria group bacterium]